jgi:hypothetical protein
MLNWQARVVCLDHWHTGLATCSLLDWLAGLFWIPDHKPAIDWILTPQWGSSSASSRVDMTLAGRSFSHYYFSVRCWSHTIKTFASSTNKRETGVQKSLFRSFVGAPYTTAQYVDTAPSVTQQSRPDTIRGGALLSQDFLVGALCMNEVINRLVGPGTCAAHAQCKVDDPSFQVSQVPSFRQAKLPKTSEKHGDSNADNVSSQLLTVARGANHGQWHPHARDAISAAIRRV